MGEVSDLEKKVNHNAHHARLYNGIRAWRSKIYNRASVEAADNSLKDSE